MAEKKKEERIEDALLKVALGYQVAEVVEEYAEVDGTMKLTKRKKTKKDVPPDLKAVQMLLAGSAEGGFEGFTDEELEEERKKLLLALSKEEKTEKKPVKKTVKKTAAKKTVRKKK